MTVNWQPHAEQLLNKTVAYILERSPQAGKKFIADVYAAGDSLAEQPTKAPREPLLANNPKEYRGLIVRRRYKLIYYINEATETVNIVTFWDTKQQPLRLKNWLGRLRLLF